MPSPASSTARPGSWNPHSRTVSTSRSQKPQVWYLELGEPPAVTSSRRRSRGRAAGGAPPPPRGGGGGRDPAHQLEGRGALAPQPAPRPLHRLLGTVERR